MRHIAMRTAALALIVIAGAGCARSVATNDPGNSILPQAKRVVEPAIRWNPLGEDPDRQQWYGSEAQVKELPNGEYQQPQVYTGGVASGDGPPSWVNLPDRPNIRYRYHRYRGRYY